MTTIKTPAPWFLYMLEDKFANLYTGISLDWERRINEHQSQGAKCAKALRGKAPVTLKYCVELPNRTIAMQAEIWMKKQSKSNKLAIIKCIQSFPFTHKPVNWNE